MCCILQRPAFFLLTLAAFAFAQPQGASISGRVVSQARTRTPIAGVQVRVGGEYRTTDAAGAFSFRNLPPGRLLIEVETTDFVRPTIGYAVTLAEGQTLGGIEITLLPMSAVEGKVVSDDGGKPVAGAMVTLIPVDEGVSGFEYRNLSSSSGPDGKFKMERVPLGQYRVMARYLRMPASPGRESPGRVFRNTYYPSAFTKADARPVTVEVGGIPASNGPTITLHWESPSKVRGRVVADKPETFRVGFAPVLSPLVDRQEANLFELVSASAAALADGSFELTGVLPGPVRLYLLTQPKGSDGYGLGIAGSIAVDVPDQGLDGVRMPSYARDITVKGRVIAEGGPPAPIVGFRVLFRMVATGLPMQEAFDAAADRDGNFQIRLERRQYSVFCLDLRSVTLDGKPVTGLIA